METPMDALVFLALRRRLKKKTGGNITLASPPTRRFSTRPHCVLLPPPPFSLPLRPPPARNQTAALAVFRRHAHIEGDSTRHFVPSRFSSKLRAYLVSKTSPLRKNKKKYIYTHTRAGSGFLSPDCKMTSSPPLFARCCVTHI